MVLCSNVSRLTYSAAPFIDLLFKSFAILNVEYPPEASHLFKFLEIISGIDYGTKMPSLLAELDTQILNFN